MQLSTSDPTSRARVGNTGCSIRCSGASNRLGTRNEVSIPI